MSPQFKDGWGYSNGPPIVAGVVALMKSANPMLRPQEIRAIIVETASLKDGFRVLDAEAAVKAAIGKKGGSAEFCHRPAEDAEGNISMLNLGLQPKIGPAKSRGQL